MDKLRLFDASLYLGKGTMLFTSTDQNKFWDEEISFDVHDSQDIDIPPEGFVMPPVEVIDALFDVYFNVRALVTRKKNRPLISKAGQSIVNWLLIFVHLPLLALSCLFANAPKDHATSSTRGPL